MILRAANRGSGSGCFMRFLFLIVAGFLLISWLPRCAQQLPQLASHTASETATGVADAAAGAVSNVGRALLNRIASLFSSARDQWNNASPADRFDLVCEHVPVEGVDKLCPYFTSALQGASDAQTAQIACYWHAAATGPNPQQTLQQINNACPRVAGDPSRLQSCLAEYVEPGDASSCLASSPEQLWSELHTMIEPIACPPGLPKSWCTTQSTAAAATQNASPPPRTDPNYLSCLQKYYTAPAVQATIGTSCGTQVNAGNATCVANSLQTFNYPGQTNLGQQYVSYCQAQPQ
jgi:hypothetical protein